MEGREAAVAALPAVSPTSLSGRYHAPLPGSIYATWRTGASCGTAWGDGNGGGDARPCRGGGGDTTRGCCPTATAHTGSAARSGGEQHTSEIAWCASGRWRGRGEEQGGGRGDGRGVPYCDPCAR